MKILVFENPPKHKEGYKYSRQIFDFFNMSDKMNHKQTPLSGWSFWVTIASSALFIFYLFSVLGMMRMEASGIVDVTAERTLFTGALFLSPLLGIWSIVAGTRTIKNRQASKKIAAIGLILGLLHSLISLAAWLYLVLISKFATAF